MPLESPSALPTSVPLFLAFHTGFYTPLFCFWRKATPHYLFWFFQILLCTHPPCIDRILNSQSPWLWDSYYNCYLSLQVVAIRLGFSWPWAFQLSNLSACVMYSMTNVLWLETGITLQVLFSAKRKRPFSKSLAGHFPMKFYIKPNMSIIYLKISTISCYLKLRHQLTVKKAGGSQLH